MQNLELRPSSLGGLGLIGCVYRVRSVGAPCTLGTEAHPLIVRVSM